MEQTKGYFSRLEGTHYEAGRQQGQFVKQNPHFMNMLVLDQPISETQLKETIHLLEMFCPGIHEEINGLCDEIQIAPNQISYYANTHLQAGCSHCAILPVKTAENSTYMLRNYDLSPQIDEMRLCSTNISNVFHHTGFAVSFFGRSEGINEHGLGVTFSACGQPVGNVPGMRPAKESGLQFWAATRTLLEQCRSTEQALDMIREMPLSANMNLIIADPMGKAALVEAFNGKKMIREIDESTDDTPFITATNHPLFPEIELMEPMKMNHSIIRQNVLINFLNQHNVVTKEQLISLVETEYPRGLTVHNYKEWFGTLHSLLFDLGERSMKVCFGSPMQNPWYTLKVGDSLPFKTIDVKTQHQNYSPDFWQMK